MKEVNVDVTRMKIARIIYPSTSLPNQIFRTAYDRYCFFDYAHLDDSSCWYSLLQAAEGQPLEIIFLDPDFEYIRTKHDGNSFGICSVDSGATSEEIRSFLNSTPSDVPAETFLNVAPTCLIAPSDGRWAMWASRMVDVAILGFSRSVDPKQTLGLMGNWKAMQTADQAIRYFSGSGKRLNDPMFLQPLVRHYFAAQVAH